MVAVTVEAAQTPGGVVPPARKVAADAAAAWHERSRALAAAGDQRLAVHTQWAADVATLHCLLWDSGLADVPDPAAQLATVARVVGEALDRCLFTMSDAQSAISLARAAIGQAFGPSVATLLGERFLPLTHLASADSSAYGCVSGVRTSHGADTLLRELDDVATDCAAVARAMEIVGLDDAAADQLRQAQLAAFEGFLVARATSGGQADLVSVDLRWELAVHRLADRPWQTLAPDVLAAELVACVAAADRDTLRTRLEGLR